MLVLGVCVTHYATISTSTLHTAHSTQRTSRRLDSHRVRLSLFPLSSSTRTAVTFACDPHDHQREEEKAKEDTCDTCDDTHGGRSGVNMLLIGVNMCE